MLGGCTMCSPVLKKWDKANENLTCSLLLSLTTSTIYNNCNKINCANLNSRFILSGPIKFMIKKLVECIVHQHRLTTKFYCESKALVYNTMFQPNLKYHITILYLIGEGELFSALWFPWKLQHIFIITTRLLLPEDKTVYQNTNQSLVILLMAI